MFIPGSSRVSGNDVVRCNPDRVGCRRLVYLAHFRKRHHSWTVVHGTRMKRLIRDRHDFCKRWTVCFSHIFWTSLAAFWDEGNRNTAEWSMEEWSVRYQTGTAWDVADFLRLHLANKWALLVLFWIRSFHVCFKSENRLSGDWCDWILGFLRFLLVVPGCQGKGERLEAGIQKTSALQVAFLIFSMILCLSAVETCGNHGFLSTSCCEDLHGGSRRTTARDNHWGPFNASRLTVGLLRFCNVTIWYI